VQLLVDNRSDSTKMHGATLRFKDILSKNKVPAPGNGSDLKKFTCCSQDIAI